MLTTTNPLHDAVTTAVTQITNYLTANGKANSWQLKVMFRLSSSVLYLALGSLLAEKKITLEADGINYLVTWGEKSTESLAQATPFEEQM